jgi:long-chain acyl-CoA synthetase
MLPRSFASLGEFAEELGASNAGEPALHAGPRRFSRGELAAHARGLASRWRAAGLLPGDVVGVVGDSGPAFVLAALSAARAGLVPLLLDPRLTGEEARAVVDRAAPRALALSAGSRWTCADGQQVFDFDHHGESSLPERGAASDAPPLSRDPHALAILLVTSGTSGQPRVVALSADNLSSNIQASYAVHPCDRGDVFLSCLPLTHAFELTTGLIGPLHVGASVAFPESRNPHRLLQTLLSEAVTHINVVPAILKMLMTELGEAAGGHEMAEALGRQLRSVVCGGAAPARELVERLVGAGMPLWLGYGLTEASPSVAVGRASDLPPGATGRALPGVRVRVDAGTGELLVRGPNVMMGYYRDPEGTAAAMAGGWLHTGDLARLDDAGHLFILGRRRDLIVTGAGLKVLPDDIESAYRSPMFAEVCAVGVPDADAGGGETPCLVVRPAAGAGGDDAAMRAEFQRLSALAGARRAFKLALVASALPRTRTLKLRRDLVRQSVIETAEEETDHDA